MLLTHMALDFLQELIDSSQLSRTLACFLEAQRLCRKSTRPVPRPRAAHSFVTSHSRCLVPSSGDDRRRADSRRPPDTVNRRAQERRPDDLRPDRDV